MDNSRPFHLGLRDDRHMVGVIRQNEQQQVQLGVAYPEDSDRRARVLAQWGIDARSPREERLDSIDQPLAQRSQAILFWQVSSTLRAQLATGQGGMSSSRRIDNQAGMLDRSHLGTERQPMAVDTRFSSHAVGRK